MIDTVKIRLDKGWFTITDPARYSSQIKAVQDERDIPKPGSPYATIRNATKAEKELHGYMPQVTIYKSLNQGVHHFADVQFSAAKILFNQNFSELKETDLDRVASELDKKLKIMGFKVHAGAARIRKAMVVSIHYGKNIPLEYHTVGEYLRMLQMCQLSKDKHTGLTHYQNGGTQFRYGTKRNGFTAYDKLKDLEFAQKRGQGYKTYEKEYECQLSLFDECEPASSQVLRFEKRLNGKANVYTALNKLGFIEERDDAILQNLFSKDIARKVLQTELEFHKTNYINSMAFKMTDELKQAEQLRKLNPGVNPKDLLSAMQFSSLLERYDYQSIANLYSDNPRQLSYFLKCYRTIKKPDGSRPDILDFIEQQLKAFETVRLGSV